MKIQTFTVVVGGRRCNAHCPYCISRMTPSEGVEGVDLTTTRINWRNFHKACILAKMGGATTVLFTGKGEPTLYEFELTQMLQAMEQHRFPLIELQTNGLLFNPEAIEENQLPLKCWYEAGLTTISISIVHYNNEQNKQIFSPASDYIDLPSVINMLHSFGFAVRLNCMLLSGYINTVSEFASLIQHAKKYGVEQLTVREVVVPEKSENEEVYTWATQHTLSPMVVHAFEGFLETYGHKLMTLEHGAVIYDVEGQNVCLSTCLTIQPETDHLRQLIYFPDGHLRYDWQYKGAILM